jgi:glycosyltransferase involved in cell wall biosynthesis
VFCYKIRFFRNVERFWRMMRDRNFYGLWHQFRRALGFRGPVPAPTMPESDRRPCTEDGSGGGVSFGSSALRILFFSHDLNLEGAPISLFELVLALRRSGVVDPEVISFQDGPLRMRYEAAGILVSIFSWSSDRLSTVKRLETAADTLAEVIRRKHPDVVFANTLRSFLAIISAKETGIPSIWNPRESASWDTVFGYLPDPVAQRAIAAIRLPYRVVFVSHASQKVWNRFDRYGNFDVIHNGIDLSRFPERGKAFDREQGRASLKVKDGEVVILCVGTINARKGQSDLVEAVEFLPRAVLERILVFLVGDDNDPYATKLKRRCRALSSGIRERIRFFSSVESVQRFYEAADIFVLSSREESFPRVTLEAMTFGLPIIATPVHGVTEQALEEDNAFFYAKGNIKELAGKIGSLVHNETLRKQMGRSSLRRLCELTTFEGMTDAYAAICREAAQKRINIRSADRGHQIWRHYA